MYEFTIIVLGLYPPIILFSAGLLRQRLPATGPMTVMGWLFLLGYTFKSFYLAHAVNSDAPYRAKHLTNDIVHTGQALVCLAVTFFVMGYLLKRQPPVQLAPQQPKARFLLDPRPLYHGLFALSVVLMVLYFQKLGLAGQLASLKFTGTKFFVSEETGVRSALGYLLIGGDFLLVYLIYAYVAGSRTILFRLYVPVMLFVMLCYFLASNRFSVLLVIIGLALATNPTAIDRNVLRKLSRYGIAGMLLLGLTFASQIRNTSGALDAAELEVVDAVSSTIEHAASGSYFMDPVKLAAIVDRNPEFLLGSTFAIFLLAPIPRTLWPEKPAIRLGPYVAAEILDYNTRSGAPPSGIGELYMNFWWFGPTIGMALLGFCLGLAESAYRRAAASPVARARYALMLLIFIFFFIGDFSFAMLFTIKYAVAALICERYWAWQFLRQSAGIPPGVTGTPGGAPDLRRP